MSRSWDVLVVMLDGFASPGGTGVPRLFILEGAPYPTCHPPLTTTTRTPKRQPKTPPPCPRGLHLPPTHIPQPRVPIFRAARLDDIAHPRQKTCVHHRPIFKPLEACFWALATCPRPRSPWQLAGGRGVVLGSDKWSFLALEPS